MLGFVPATRFEQTPNLDVRFPPLPRTVADVSHLLSQQEDEPDTHRLVAIVDSDPAVAAAVLRRINSAYYGMRRRIGDIRKSVYLMGFLEVCNIVLTEGMLKLRSIVQTDEQVRIVNQIIQISIGAAAFSHKLSSFLHLPGTSTAYTSGILHSIGRLVLLYNKPHDYEALWCTSERGLAPDAADERVIFGTDHQQLGALAADHWNLPENIVAVIGHYLDPERLSNADLRDLALTVSASVAAAEEVYLSDGARTAGRPSPSLQALARSTQTRTQDLIQFLDSERPATWELMQQSFDE